MRFIFFDTETTGTSVAFDQIIQFAAVLTDARFQIIDKLEMRCRRLPWVVPAPSAMLVTNMTPSRMDDRSLPSHPAFVTALNERLRAWRPAVFIGYNSAWFDERFLQRALWQTLLPPYLTVTGGNSRFDLLPLARMLQILRPDSLPWPVDESGVPTFKLDRLAPQFGFDHSYAHEAVADAEATLFLAKLFAETFPEVWETLINRTAKDAAQEAFRPNGLGLFVERARGTSRTWWGRRIDNDESGRHAIFADLTADWPAIAAKDSLPEPLPHLRRIFLNRAPPILTEEEAQTILGLAISPTERMHSQFLESWPRISSIAADRAQVQLSQNDRPLELEERIHEKFADAHDTSMMAEFHRAAWSERPGIAEQFNDMRLRAIAKRILYVMVPDLLAPHEWERIRIAIAQRLFPDRPIDQYPWRSVAKAKAELQAMQVDACTSHPAKFLDEIGKWLDNFGD